MNPSVGTLSTSGLYTAPSSISATQTVTITATSAADSTKFASAVVTLTPPVSVTISPAAVTLSGSQTQQFVASVTGTSNTSVTWTMNPSVGTLSTSGLYTAPSSVSVTQTVTITATSAANSTYASAIVTLIPTTSMTISPSSISLSASQTQQFVISVTSTAVTPAVSPAVTWSMNPNVGTLAAGGLYTAPSNISAVQTVTITATNTANSSKFASAIVTLMPTVSVKISPASVSLSSSQTQQFAASVTGSGNTAVTWSMNPSLGTLSAAGLYTAPASIGATQTVTIKATSAANSAIFAIATITLVPPASVSISPTSVSLSSSQTQQFTANIAVVWTMSPAVGVLSAGGLYTAPASIGATQAVTIKATSAANSAIFATATITLVPAASVTISPTSVSLSSSQTQQFVAAVAGSLNTGVNWTMNPSVGTLSTTGLYKAPKKIGSAQTVTITATSSSDPTKSASAIVTLVPSVWVTVSPTAVTLSSSQMQQFSANTAVIWTMSPALGVLSTSGLYMAPASISATRIVIITATDADNPARFASAAVILQAGGGVGPGGGVGGGGGAPPPTGTVTVTPGLVIITPSTTPVQQFTATVNGSVTAPLFWRMIIPAGASYSAAVYGTLLSNGLYIAPSSITQPTIFTIQATDVANPALSGTAEIRLSPNWK
jgi:hypothetical protein